MKTEILNFVLASGLLIGPAAFAQAPFGLPGPAANPPAATPSHAPRVPGRPVAGFGLYIAGDGFSLEQAINDGLREKTGDARFAVLVLGAEISKLGIHGATSEVSEVILRGVQGGAVLNVCERDAKRMSFSAQDFLPMVRIVRGFSAAETGAPATDDTGAPPLLRRIRALCSD